MRPSFCPSIRTLTVSKLNNTPWDSFIPQLGLSPTESQTLWLNGETHNNTLLFSVCFSQYSVHAVKHLELQEECEKEDINSSNHKRSGGLLSLLWPSRAINLHWRLWNVVFPIHTHTRPARTSKIGGHYRQKIIHTWKRGISHHHLWFTEAWHMFLWRSL